MAGKLLAFALTALVVGSALANVENKESRPGHHGKRVDSNKNTNSDKVTCPSAAEVDACRKIALKIKNGICEFPRGIKNESSSSGSVRSSTHSKQSKSSKAKSSGQPATSLFHDQVLYEEDEEDVFEDEEDIVEDPDDFFADEDTEDEKVFESIEDSEFDSETWDQLLSELQLDSSNNKDGATVNSTNPINNSNSNNKENAAKPDGPENRSKLGARKPQFSLLSNGTWARQPSPAGGPGNKPNSISGLQRPSAVSGSNNNNRPIGAGGVGTGNVGAGAKPIGAGADKRRPWRMMPHSVESKIQPN